MPASNRPPGDDDLYDDGADDAPQYANDRFDDPPPVDDPYAPDPYRADASRADAYRGDPYAAEPVLADEQNVPNSFNVRNIVLLATGGFVLLLGAFLWSISGEDEAQRTAEVDPTVLSTSPGAQAPADILGATGAPPEDDLAALLNDPGVASGGEGAYGPYSEAPPPQTSANYSDPAPTVTETSTPSDDNSGGSGAGPTGPREPTYSDRRRDIYYAALGLGSRGSVGNRAAAASPVSDDPYAAYNPTGSAGGGTGGAAGGGSAGGAGGANGLTLASTSTGGGGRSGASGSRRPGPPSLAPSAGFRQAATAANAPFAPFTLAQGTIVPVVLETAVSSQIQGVFIARTTEDVYDRTRRHVLIPRGSQVVSSYQDAEAVGDRLQATAGRLNLPDGRSVDFGSAGLFDSQGRQGLRDQVQRHTASRVGAGALLTIAGVVTSVTQRRAERGVILVQNSDGSVAQVPIGDDVRNETASRGAQGLQNALSQRAEQALNRPNTILLRPGLRGTLILQQDVDMRQPYYNDGGTVPVGRSPFDTRGSRASPAGNGTRTAEGQRQPAPRGTTRTASALRP